MITAAIITYQVAWILTLARMLQVDEHRRVECGLGLRAGGFCDTAWVLGVFVVSFAWPVVAIVFLSYVILRDEGIIRSLRAG